MYQDLTELAYNFFLFETGTNLKFHAHRANEMLIDSGNSFQLCKHHKDFALDKTVFVCAPRKRTQWLFFVREIVCSQIEKMQSRKNHMHISQIFKGG